MGFGLNLEYLGEMGRGVLLPTGIRRDAIGKISDFELDSKWRWNEEEKCSHAWSGLILVVCLIAASLTEKRGVPAIEVSASSTNLSHQQSIGIDLGNFKFSDS